MKTTFDLLVDCSNKFIFEYSVTRLVITQSPDPEDLNNWDIIPYSPGQIKKL